MIMKTEDRMKRRRKNLDVYKIQGADTISMLRLLLYWWHHDLSPLIHSHTYHLTGSPFTEHNGTCPPQGVHSTYQSLNVQRSHSLLATRHTVCNATQSSYKTLQYKIKLETKQQQSPFFKLCGNLNLVSSYNCRNSIGKETIREQTTQYILYRILTMAFHNWNHSLFGICTSHHV